MAMGTQETKDIIKAAADGVKLGLQIGKDKAVGLQDIPLVFKLVQDLPAMIQGITDVPKELADLDETEAADLVAYAMSELALDEGKAKVVVDKALKAIIANYELAQALIAPAPAAPSQAV